MLLKGIKEGNCQVDKSALKEILRKIFAISNVRINEEKLSANAKETVNLVIKYVRNRYDYRNKWCDVQIDELLHEMNMIDKPKVNLKERLCLFKNK